MKKRFNLNDHENSSERKEKKLEESRQKSGSGRKKIIRNRKLVKLIKKYSAIFIT